MGKLSPTSVLPKCSSLSVTVKVPFTSTEHLHFVTLRSWSFSTRAAPCTWKPTCSFYVNNNKAESPACHTWWEYSEIFATNFHALPCRQSVPQYQLQQEGNLASSKTKVCIRVKQLFTLFELQYLTHGRLCAWSFASFTLNLWQRVGWITMSFSLHSPPFSCCLLFYVPSTSFTAATLLPLCTPLELFICHFKISACSKLVVTHKLHYVFSLLFL